MKRITFFLLMVFAIPAMAQFKYSAWNIGPQFGAFKIKNGMARYESNGPSSTDVYLADSADCRYSVTNLRINAEDVRLNYFVKLGATFPLGKHTERDSQSVMGKHFEYTMKFGYGFDIKDKAGFLFGLNFGLYGLTQYANPNNMPSPTKFDYFVPSAGSTALTGQHMFGAMGAWEGGLLISNVISLTDNWGLQTTYSHNNLVSHKKTISGRNDQLEFSLHYSNDEIHNIGFSLNLMQNWMHFKGYSIEEQGNSFSRIYPKTKVSMTTIYVGINLPIVFKD